MQTMPITMIRIMTKTTNKIATNKTTKIIETTAMCTHCLVDMTESLDLDVNEETHLVLGDSWFGSYDCVVAMKSELGQARHGFAALLC
jgi:hypothetical protein